jgi:hypothetical protein
VQVGKQYTQQGRARQVLKDNDWERLLTLKIEISPNGGLGVFHNFFKKNSMRVADKIELFTVN